MKYDKGKEVMIVKHNSEHNLYEGLIGEITSVHTSTQKYQVYIPRRSKSYWLTEREICLLEDINSNEAELMIRDFLVNYALDVKNEDLFNWVSNVDSEDLFKDSTELDIAKILNDYEENKAKKILMLLIMLGELSKESEGSKE